MVYVRKKKKNIFYRVAIILLAILLASVFILRFLNSKLDVIVADMVEEGVKNTITKMINEAVTQSMREGDYKDILSITYTSDGKVQGMVADSIKINLLCADVGARISEKLDALDRFYVEVDVGDVLDDIIIFGGFPYSFSADVVPVGGIETGIESEFLSAGINQTNYRLKMRVKVGVTAIMLITTSTIDISTTVSIAEMLIVGDVPTVYWG
jgi:sporulation protein YunB